MCFFKEVIFIFVWKWRIYVRSALSKQ